MIRIPVGIPRPVKILVINPDLEMKLLRYIFKPSSVVAFMIITLISLFYLYLTLKYPTAGFSFYFYGHQHHWQHRCHRQSKRNQIDPFHVCQRVLSTHSDIWDGAEHNISLTMSTFLKETLHFPDCSATRALVYGVMGFDLMCDSSEHMQSTVIWTTYFSKMAHGLYVESGAYDGIYKSNSLMMERFGWKGLLIEPSPVQYGHLLLKNRSAIALNACLLGPNAVNEVVHKYLNVPNDETSAKIRESCVYSNTMKCYSVPCLNLHTILDYVMFKQIDFFSLDVERSELAVLKSIPIKRIRLMLVVGGVRTPRRSWLVTRTGTLSWAGSAMG